MMQPITHSILPFEIPDFSSVRIMVAGDVMLDRYVWGTVDRISPEAPIPVVLVKDRTHRLGGAGNVAANLASLECRTTLAGLLGVDRAGEKIGEMLAARNIRDKSLRHATIPTVSKTRVMGGAQQVVRLDDEQPDLISSKNRDELLAIWSAEIPSTDVVILSDYGKGVLEKYTIRQCIHWCREKETPVFIDPKQADWSVYSGATCITPNIVEFAQACAVTGLDPDALEASAASLAQYYNIGHLLVTRGSAGMALFDKNGQIASVQAMARDVYDVSGAGDTVIALIAAGFAAGLEMANAMEMANIGAGEVVGRVGTYALSRQELTQAAEHRAGGTGLPAACPLDRAKSMVEHWRMLGKNIVFTNGCFDILHHGHVSLLHRARAMGDCLVVGLNTDASIRRIKGPARPILDQKDRAAILAALSSVDLVVYFDEDTPIEIIRQLRPDILAKGADYTQNNVVGGDLVQSWGGRVELLDLMEEKSTTGIVDKIRKKPDTT